jgi:hypothetical protein
VAIFPIQHGIAESPPLAQLPISSFFRLFTAFNQLDTISHFFFLPGMLFEDTTQWWGTKKLRPHPHEGIDLYLMEDMETGTTNLLPKMLIPAMLSGHPVHFHRDFLGETLYIRHTEIRERNAVLHTIYGHLQPSQDCSCPSLINKGDILGEISHPSQTSIVPAHLHISCAWIPEDLLVQKLNWGYMAADNDIIFIDPLPFLLQ